MGGTGATSRCWQKRWRAFSAPPIALYGSTRCSGMKNTSPSSGAWRRRCPSWTIFYLSTTSTACASWRQRSPRSRLARDDDAVPVVLDVLRRLGDLLQRGEGRTLVEFG